MRERRPSREAILAVMAEVEPLDATLARFPGLSRDALLSALGHTPQLELLAAPKPKPRARRLVVNTDGACRGNPGPSSIGIVIADERGETIDEIARTIGRRTNNYAEYEAVRVALERAQALGAEAVHLRADSQLAVRQLSGEYKVKNENIRPLFEAVKQLERGFPGGVRYEHVRREQNREADALANLALDRGL